MDDKTILSLYVFVFTAIIISISIGFGYWLHKSRFKNIEKIDTEFTVSRKVIEGVSITGKVGYKVNMNEGILTRVIVFVGYLGQYSPRRMIILCEAVNTTTGFSYTEFESNSEINTRKQKRILQKLVKGI